MPRSLAKERMLFEVPVVQEAPRAAINRPANRLSFDDIVKDVETVKSKLEKAKNHLKQISENLKARWDEYDERERKDLQKEKDKLIEDIHNLSETLKSIDLAVYKEAFDVLEYGDPVSYIIGVYNRMHLGDTALGKVLLLSIMNSVITNSEGLQPKLTGESGKGKTDAAKAMFHLIPNRPYKYEGSVSSKALFFNPDDEDGMIIFSDDVIINPDIENTLKRSMGSFQDDTTHTTLDKTLKYIKTILKKRKVWWLTAVKTDYSDELVNRLFDITVDESADMDKKVAAKVFANAADGVDKMPEDDEVQVCRAMLDIVKRQLFKVQIPFGRSISWNVPGDRRNPARFVALVYGFAVLRHLQREEIDGFTIAIKEDFEDAKALYEECKGSQISKLTKAELSLVRWMVAQGTGLTINEIVNGYTRPKQISTGEERPIMYPAFLKSNGMKYSYKGIQKMIIGEPERNRKGLIDKIAMEVSNSPRNTRYFIREFKEFKGEAVSLNE